jgi:hypothetical protein
VIVVDTTVLVYAAGTDHPFQTERSWLLATDV